MKMPTDQQTNIDFAWQLTFMIYFILKDSTNLKKSFRMLIVKVDKSCLYKNLIYSFTDDYAFTQSQKSGRNIKTIRNKMSISVKRPILKRAMIYQKTSVYLMTSHRPQRSIHRQN